MICIQHFEENTFKILGPGKYKLLPNAVPTIFESPPHSDNQPDVNEFVEVDDVKLLEMEVQALNKENISLRGEIVCSERKICDLNKKLESQTECIEKLKQLVEMYESYCGKTPEFINEFKTGNENISLEEKLKV